MIIFLFIYYFLITFIYIFFVTPFEKTFILFISWTDYLFPHNIKMFSCYSEDVDIDIQDNGDGTVDIYYTVADAGEYTLSIKFGGQPIPDGFYTFTVNT